MRGRKGKVDLVAGVVVAKETRAREKKERKNERKK